MAERIEKMVALLALTFFALTLVFGAINGALMCFAPKRHIGLWRKWYIRVGNPAWKLDFGPQFEYRTAGIVVLAGCIFFGWKLAEAMKALIH